MAHGTGKNKILQHRNCLLSSIFCANCSAMVVAMNKMVKNCKLVVTTPKSTMRNCLIQCSAKLVSNLNRNSVKKNVWCGEKMAPLDVGAIVLKEY